MFLCSSLKKVNPYVSVHLSDNTTGKTYIMMEARLGALFKSESEYTLLDKWVHKTAIASKENIQSENE